MGHYSKLCRSKMPETPKPRHPQRVQQQGYSQSPGSSQTRRLCHVTKQNQENNQTIVDNELESIDPESTLYLKELTEDWDNINFVQQKKFSPVRIILLNRNISYEIWIPTICNSSEKIDCLADIGFPQNFIIPTTANKLMTHNQTSKSKS